MNRPKKPIRNIPYGHQSIDESDKEAVLAVLNSEWLTQGPAINRFEASVEAHCGNGVKAVAANSATAALHIGCLALGLGPGDSLWTSPNSFVASSNCALYCGAKVDFVDIDPKTLNLCPIQLESKLKEAKARGTLPKIIVPVHFAGRSAEMAAIGSLAKKYGVKVMEDASHSIGGTYEGRPIGSCIHSDLAVFSFHPVKIITTAEGGMIVCRDETLYKRAQLFRSHGITRDAGLMQGNSDGPWYYQQIALGYNYRLTDIQAALGESQMKRIESFVARRRELVGRYRQALSDLPLVLPDSGADQESAWHLFVIRVSEKDRRRIFDELRAAGIGVNVHYIPIHTQPYYREMGFRPGDFPAAEAYYKSTISLPMYHGMRDEDQDHVIECLKSILT